MRERCHKVSSHSPLLSSSEFRSCHCEESKDDLSAVALEKAEAIPSYDFRGGEYDQHIPLRLFGGDNRRHRGGETPSELGFDSSGSLGEGGLDTQCTFASQPPSTYSVIPDLPARCRHGCGIQKFRLQACREDWIPVFTGMTEYVKL